MPIPVRILLITDMADDAELMRSCLANEGFQPDWTCVQTEVEYQAALATCPDLILTGWSLLHFSGLRALELMHTAGLDIPFIIVSDSIGEETVVEALHQGADDYVLKDRPARLGSAVRRALAEKQRRAERQRDEDQSRESEQRLRERFETVNLNATRRETAHAHAEDTIRRQVEHLTALREIDQAITSSFDLRLNLKTILTHVSAQLSITAASVLLYNASSQMLEFAAGCGFHTKAIERARLRVGESHAGRAVLERRLVQVVNLREPGNQLVRPLLAEEGFVSYFGVPLIAKGEVKGVLEIFHAAPLDPNEEWLDLLNALARQAAIAIDNAQLFDDLQRSKIELTLAYDATIEGWSRALDLRDRQTEGHTERVTEMTVKLARACGLSEEELPRVRWGALLHDIGKMGIPDVILLKPGPLTDEEWAVMKQHPTIAYEILSPIRYLRSALDIPYHHHEWWDGTGYPLGLRGEQIPLPARIFAVVDVWDALRSDRPYRSAWLKQAVTECLRNQAGTHFDPHVVPVFLQLLETEDVSSPETQALLAKTKE